MIVEIRALRPADDRSPFRSGDPALDLFFHRYAGQNQFRHHVGVSYVAVAEARILGFDAVGNVAEYAVDSGSWDRGGSFLYGLQAGVLSASQIPYPDELNVTERGFRCAR